MQKKYDDAAEKQRAYRARKKLMLTFASLDEHDQEQVRRFVEFLRNAGPAPKEGDRNA